jgi:hypothetical protein
LTQGVTLGRVANANSTSASKINSLSPSPNEKESEKKMGQKLTVNVKDVNGLNSKTDFWVNDTLAAVGAVQAIANLSNAAVVSAFLTREIDISGLAANNAVAANVETVAEKAKIRLSGPDSESAGATRLTTTISIPAPVGTIINAVTGAVNGALVTPFVGKVTTYNGLVTDTVDKVYYSRSR